MSLFVHSHSLLRCDVCDGDGDVFVGWNCPKGCTCNGHLHSALFEECDACGGEGTVNCVICRDNPACGLDVDGWPACAFCLQAEAEEHAEQSTQRARALSTAG